MPVAPIIIAAAITAAGTAYSARQGRKGAERVAESNDRATDAAQNAQKKAAMMPSADNKGITDAKRRSIVEQMAARGRASTIMSQGGSDSLGGG